MQHLPQLPPSPTKKQSSFMIGMNQTELPKFVLALAFVFSICGTSSFAIALYGGPGASADAIDAHCRVGYYIHDSADLVYSARNCPPKLDCRLLRPDVPQEEIRCKMEHLGSPHEFPYYDQPDYSARNVFRFSCSSLTECRRRHSNEFCYRSSRALQLARDDPSNLQLIKPTDAAVVCA